jgi:murein L,D-transpeptidase YcbB/YkuD
MSASTPSEILEQRRRDAVQYTDCSKASRCTTVQRRAKWPVALTAVLAGCLLATSAIAQDQDAWWQKLPGFSGRDEFAPPSRPSRRRRLPQNDLRTDPAPLRSQAMLQLMQVAVARYQKIVAAGGWRLIPAGKILRPEQINRRVGVLRARLLRSGDLAPRHRRTGNAIYTFDDPLKKALIRFQERHGLRPSGIVGRATMRALNVSAANRLAQLRINLVRLRDLLSAEPEPRYILVNLPGYQLEAVRDNVIERRHRVIVGKRDLQTPGLSVMIKGINFHPFWRVPDSIAHRDLIPRLQKDPKYLDREHIRVLTRWGGTVVDPQIIDWSLPSARELKFRQDPGDWNALGLVRINMPNKHIVYMHDTPLKRLFGSHARAFSAGCVRVKGVFKLVTWILQEEDGWPQNAVDQAIAAREALDVKLKTPVPVHFTYITAWASSDGRVAFRADLYGRDGIRELASAYVGASASGPKGRILSP